MNADEYAKRPNEVQHLAEVRAKSVRRWHRCSTACTDNPMNSYPFVQAWRPTVAQMSPGINSVVCERLVLPLSVRFLWAGRSADKRDSVDCTFGITFGWCSVVPREWMKMSGGKKEKFAFNREKLNKYIAQVCKSYRMSTRRKSNVIHLACNGFAAGELCESA